MLLFVDGFDHYNSSAHCQRKWSKITNTPNFSYTGSRRSSSQYMYGAYNVDLYKYLTQQKQTIIMGFAYYHTANQGSARPIVQWLGRNDNQANFHIRTDESIGVDARDNVTPLAQSAPGVVLLNTWQYHEGLITLSGANSIFEYRIDGATVLSGSGDVHYIETEYTWGVLLSPGMSNDRFDDFYVIDNTGARNNSFLGDCRVDVIRPESNSSVSWTPSGAAQNWDCVHDYSPAVTGYVIDDDTTKVYSTTLNQEDIYNTTNLETLVSGAVYGAAMNICGEKEGIGLRMVAPEIQIGATTSSGSEIALHTAYHIAQYIWEENPTNGSPFTQTVIDNAKFGHKLTT